MDIPNRRYREGAEFPCFGSRPPCSPPFPPSLIKRALLFFQRRCPLSERCPRRVTQAAGPWHGSAVPSPESLAGRPEGTGAARAAASPRPASAPSSPPAPLPALNSLPPS